MLQITCFENDEKKMIDFNRVFEFVYGKHAIKRDTKFAKESPLDRCFVVYSDGQPVARAAAMINYDIQYHNQKIGLIGYFECINDLDISRYLFDHVFSYLRDLDCEYCIGPLNGNTWQRYRITKPSDNPDFFLDNVNPPYYYQLFTDNDWEIVSEYETTHVTKSEFDVDRVSEFTTKFNDLNIHIRRINLDQYTDELKKLYDISINSFVDNLFYSPINWETFQSMYGQLKNIISADYVLIAESDKNEPIAFIFALPNILSSIKRSLVIKTIAIKPNYRSLGLASYLVQLIHKAAFDGGQEEILHALMYKNNISTKIAAQHSEPYREYVLMGKTL